MMGLGKRLFAGIVLAASFATPAEASRFAFSGTDAELIVWDGVSDVRTSNNTCLPFGTLPCLTTVLGAVTAADLFVSVTVLDPVALEIESLFLTLARPTAEGCQSFAGIICEPSLIAAWASGSDAILPPTGQDAVVYLLPVIDNVIVPGLTEVRFDLPQATLDFMNAMDPQQLAAARFGFFLTADSPTRARLELASDIQAVPEPATLLLLGMGLAFTAAIRRRRS
jgi:hypothetical protein